MTRRPRYPLIVRLAWIEAELGRAARLLHMLVVDVSELRTQADDADVRTLLLAGLATAALLLHGVDPRLLNRLLDELGPDGDVGDAEETGAEVMQQVWTLMADGGTRQ